MRKCILYNTYIIDYYFINILYIKKYVDLGFEPFQLIYQVLHIRYLYIIHVYMLAPALPRLTITFDNN